MDYGHFMANKEVSFFINLGDGMVIYSESNIIIEKRSVIFMT